MKYLVTNISLNQNGLYILTICGIYTYKCEITVFNWRLNIYYASSGKIFPMVGIYGVINPFHSLWNSKNWLYYVENHGYDCGILKYQIFVGAINYHSLVKCLDIQKFQFIPTPELNCMPCYCGNFFCYALMGRIAARLETIALVIHSFVLVYIVGNRQ